MNLTYRQKANGMIAMMVGVIALYAVFFYHGTRGYDHAGLPITGVDDTHGFLIKLGAGIPSFLLCWACLGWRRQLLNAAEKGLG